MVYSNNNSSLVLGAYGNGAYHLANSKEKSDLLLQVMWVLLVM